MADALRVDPPFTGDERATLTGFLDWQRGTLAWKCADLSPEELRRRAVPPSNLSLLGLVRHLAEVERDWFRQDLAGEAVPDLFRTPTDPEADLDEIEGADATAAFTTWSDECETSRSITDRCPLDASFTHPAMGPISLRWILVHMIEEYARHNGHADLLRERIDGAVGE